MRDAYIWGNTPTFPEHAVTTTSTLHTAPLAGEAHAERLLSALYADDVARHLLGDQPAPTPAQVATTLRALADFPLCVRILPMSERRHRSGDRVSVVAFYLADFADHLAHRAVRTPYNPEFWVLGAPVTDRLQRLVASAGEQESPTAQQSAATLLALADTREMELPRRIVEVAGDGDLPWNGSTGIGRFLRELADLVAAQA